MHEPSEAELEEWATLYSAITLHAQTADELGHSDELMTRFETLAARLRLVIHALRAERSAHENLKVRYASEMYWRRRTSDLGDENAVLESRWQRWEPVVERIKRERSHSGGSRAEIEEARRNGKEMFVWPMDREAIVAWLEND